VIIAAYSLPWVRKMKRIWIDDGSVEVGLDEAGRGSLWGRLYVGAVVMSPDDEAYFDHGAAVLNEIADSKKLTRRKRAILADFIRENAIEVAVAYAEPEEIDRDNILQADMSAMHRALDGMIVPFQRILVDGDMWRPYRCSKSSAVTGGPVVEALTIVEGDAVSLPIAAASIIAKEAHDQWVRDEIGRRPELNERYGLGSNMGYGTATHMAGLKTWGADVLHRQSFSPVAAVVPPSKGPAKKPLFKSV
jgi:ribonuclease HII